MEEKKSTPTKIDFKKEWKGDKGTVYYFNIEFANGDKGQFSSNKMAQDKFVLNTETPYTREEKVRGDYTDIIINKPSSGKGNGGGRPFDMEFDKMKNHLICRQNALTNATSFIVGRNATLAPDKQLLSKDAIELAQKMYEWTIGPFKEKLQ